jgi:hypothetical protein
MSISVPTTSYKPPAPFSVFISYAHEDLPVAERFRDVLSRPGIAPFLAQTSVHAGESLDRSIRDAIKSADLFLLLWSERSCTSDWVHDELGGARHQGKQIVPIVLDATAKARLPAFVRDIKYLSAEQGIETALDTVKEQVNAAAREKCDADRSRGPGVIALTLVGLAALASGGRQ